MSHCLVIKVPVSQTAHLLYHIFQILSSTFLTFLKKFFQRFLQLFAASRISLSTFRCFVIHVSQTARLLYHNFLFLSTTFFKFFKLFKLYIQNVLLQQLSYNTTASNTCQQLFSIFLFFCRYRFLSPDFLFQVLFNLQKGR